MLLSAFAVVSCAPTYVSNTRNVPMFTEAGEFTANVSYVSGVNAQLAYSFSDHLAGMANGNVIFNKMDFTEDERPPNPHHLFAEGGLGYFTGREKVRFEAFGGYGVGKGYGREPRGVLNVFFNNEEQHVVALATYKRIFFQPSLGVIFDNSMLVISTRLSAVKFGDYSVVENDLAQYADPPTAGYHYVFEPALTWKFYTNHRFNPFFQLASNTPFKAQNFRINYFQVAVGVQFHQLRARKDGD